LKKCILLTGASGFIGQGFIELNSEKYNIESHSLQKNKVSDIDFSRIYSVVHLAGIAHQMQKIDNQIYFDVNHHLTVELAKAAKANGVTHFLFMSTIKVYGEKKENEVLTEYSTCNPEDAYGKSKLQAEQALQQLESDTFKVSIVRPPLVYGPRVKGNMIRLIQLADWSIPLQRHQGFS